MASGGYRWHLSRATPFRSEFGAIERWFGTATDIDELKTREIERQVLLDEANHRIGNMFAMIQSIARLSMRSKRDPEERFSDFQKRLHSFAAGHAILVGARQGEARLFELIERVTHACGIEGRRMARDGSNVLLSPNAGLMLALALHELCTNAVKYGALSVDTGSVAIDCSPLPEGRSRLAWTERGGPPVTAPTRQGLGSQLIEGALAAALEGSATLRFEPSGLVCVIEGRLGPAG